MVIDGFGGWFTLDIPFLYPNVNSFIPNSRQLKHVRTSKTLLLLPYKLLSFVYFVFCLPSKNIFIHYPIKFFPPIVQSNSNFHQVGANQMNVDVPFWVLLVSFLTCPWEEVGVPPCPILKVWLVDPRDICHLIGGSILWFDSSIPLSPSNHLPHCFTKTDSRTCGTRNNSMDFGSITSFHFIPFPLCIFLFSTSPFLLVFYNWISLSFLLLVIYNYDAN